MSGYSCIYLWILYNCEGSYHFLRKYDSLKKVSCLFRKCNSSFEIWFLPRKLSIRVEKFDSAFVKWLSSRCSFLLRTNVFRSDIWAVPRIINYSFRKYYLLSRIRTFRRKLIMCFENMICSFKHITYPTEVKYLLRKYDYMYVYIYIHIKNINI